MLEFSNMEEYRTADNFLIWSVGKYYEAREREREREREVKNVCIVEISPNILNLLNVVLS